MTVKSITLLMNDYCNSKCNSCNIWNNNKKENLELEKMSGGSTFILSEKPVPVKLL